jgi:hypothetical protein
MFTSVCTVRILLSPDGEYDTGGIFSFPPPANTVPVAANRTKAADKILFDAFILIPP